MQGVISSVHHVVLLSHPTGSTLKAERWHCQAHGGPARTPSLQGPLCFDPEDIPGAEEGMCAPLPNPVTTAGCSTAPFMSPPWQPGLGAALGFRHE